MYLATVVLTDAWLALIRNKPHPLNSTSIHACVPAASSETVSSSDVGDLILAVRFQVDSV